MIDRVAHEMSYHCFCT